MCRHVRRVRECRMNLRDAQGVFGCNYLGGLTSSECTDNGGNVNARAAETWLPKAYIRVHRDTWKHFHATTLAP